MDFRKISNLQFDGIDTNDYPDFADAFCIYGEYDGEEMTDDQLDELNASGEFYDLLIQSII